MRKRESTVFVILQGQEAGAQQRAGNSRRRLTRWREAKLDAQLLGRRPVLVLTFGSSSSHFHQFAHPPAVIAICSGPSPERSTQERKK